MCLWMAAWVSTRQSRVRGSGNDRLGSSLGPPEPHAAVAVLRQGA